ncbi:ATP-dependent Clp protease ATP-binding subunit [Streptomyces antibioticus]|uniref:ATP-dependent Clp protease ATP-binding subunit n=1 Tax=Streptomyces antibioticus TaxID=1890 RepID=UPI00225B37DE|nr:AAA family ATPase [Streptomyces antibioticus]MCX4741734.1 AAA family ATPase [Streptomyces antibioticus]MCX5172804.1 AAA family ATPase [Streptomyces antibioticus]
MTTPGFGFGRSPFEEFDELMSRFFGGAGGGGPASPARRPQRVDIGSLLSERARELVAQAREIAAEEGSEDLDARHLLAAATTQDSTRRLLAEAGADPDRIRTRLSSGHGGGARTEPTSLTPAAKRALLDAYQISRAEGSSYIGPEHLLRALAVNPESAAGRTLAESGWEGATRLPEGGERKAPSSTPTIDEFGRDLTEDARAGRLDPVIGRDDEVEQTIEVLSRRSKNNPVLIGDPGVGKTAIVEGIAQRIASGDVPKTLEGKRLVSLDLAGMVAGTKYRGEFEERLKKLLDEVGEHGDGLVLFLDEMHTVVGAGGGGEGAMDAGNMLKPALARGELHLIGATTIDEYRKHIEKDAALERRFAPILVGEPSVDDTIEILRGLRDRYEAHHQVRITDEAVVAAAELSDRYITSRFLPDKAIDLMDQAAARVRLRSRTPLADTREIEDRVAALNREKDQAVADEEYERAKELRDRIKEAEAELDGSAEKSEETTPKVTADDIAEVVSRSTGIPVAQLTEEERARLMKLEEHLHERVVGQDEAITAVARAVRRARAGMSDPNRPVGSFLFLGPTGVGKTELARALAAALFGDEHRMIRLDMSEFQERHTVSRLVGAPPGYVGHEEAGQLTEAVRRQPYSVVLFDEIEKAHPDVFNTLLQILDDGRLTDSQGRTVDFKNTVVIMTSNIGADRILAAGVEDYTAVRETVMPVLQQHFRPEFLNRIDEIIVFRGLERGQIREIVDLLLEHTKRRLRAQDVDLEVTDGAADLLGNLGYQPDFGARPLRRTIQREVDDRLADLLLSGQLNPGDRARVDAVDGHIVVHSDHPATT